MARMLASRWNGPRIDFGFMQCPTCREPIGHLALKELLEPIVALKHTVERKVSGAGAAIWGR